MDNLDLGPSRKDFRGGYTIFKSGDRSSIDSKGLLRDE